MADPRVPMPQGFNAEGARGVEEEDVDIWPVLGEPEIPDPVILEA